MPIWRFLSFDDARDALWSQGEERDHLRRVAWLWSFSQRLWKPRLARGVHRYPGVEDAQRAWEEWQGPGGPAA